MIIDTVRRLLVTSALPYANGHIHIGHLTEYIQTDIWVRYQRLAGNRCVYICADDTHGTAISIRAQQEGRREEEVIGEMNRAHQRDFEAFNISFDHYGSTNSEANRALCSEFWKALREAGMMPERHRAFGQKEVQQFANAFDRELTMMERSAPSGGLGAPQE